MRSLTALTIFGGLILVGGLVHTLFVLDATRPRKVCPVHQAPLKMGLVEIRYGRIMPGNGRPPGYGEASRSEFPHARAYHAGGCVVGRKMWAWVSFCPDCREAQAAWLADHAGG